MDGELLMSDTTFRQELQSFAVELRKLAYTMPAGHEDRLIHLSERMARRARQLIQVDAHAM